MIPGAQPRHPSSSIRLTDQASVRRRSTNLTPVASSFSLEPLVAKSEPDDHSQILKTHRKPQWKLWAENSACVSVQRCARVVSRHPVSEERAKDDIQELGKQADPYTDIPLTPTMKRMDSSMKPLPVLPTPDFPPVRTILARGLSLFSTSAHALHSSSNPTRAPPMRGDTTLCLRAASSFRSQSSGTSSSSQFSGTSSSSVDLGHHAIIPSLGPIRKFTHKWVRPLSMRTDRSSATATEEGVSGRIERWTTHKWCLLLSVLTVFSYGTAILTYSILTWFGTWEHATVSYVANYDILILATLAGSVLVLSALLGALGTLLNSRPILAIYALLLWPALIALFAVGYTAYKRATFSLTSKLDFAWSHYYTAYGRLLLQDALHCCGYLSPLHAAEPSARCYARTALPGCKGKLYRVEQKQLVGAWGVAFAVAPLHLVVMVVALLCANHVTRTFGKGVMPREYWLTVADVRADAERVAKAAWVLSPKVVRTGGGDVPREDTECCDQRAL